MMDLTALTRATRLAEELKNIRQSLVYLKEDRAPVVYVKVEDLTQTYGSDRRRFTFPYAKARLLDVVEAEERRLVAELTDLGVDAKPEAPR